MLKHLPLALTAAVVISMTAIASVAAIDDDTPTPTTVETPEVSETPTPTPSPEVTPTPEPEETDTPDEAEGEDEADAAEDGETEDPNKAAQAIADTFGVPVEEVMELHDQGIGFGALFKLYKLACATGVDVNDLIAGIEEEGGGWSFGKRFNELTDEEKAQCEGLPKNLGQAISGHSDDSDAGDDGEDGEDGDEGEQTENARSNKHSSGRGRGHH